MLPFSKILFFLLPYALLSHSLSFYVCSLSLFITLSLSPLPSPLLCLFGVILLYKGIAVFLEVLSGGICLDCSGCSESGVT